MLNSSANPHRVLFDWLALLVRLAMSARIIRNAHVVTFVWQLLSEDHCFDQSLHFSK